MPNPSSPPPLSVQTTPCGVCGEARPASVRFCRSCNRYDTWLERSPLGSALRQVLLGTVLVGLLSAGMNSVLQRQSRCDARREAAQGRREALHAELQEVRKSLIRLHHQLVNDSLHCQAEDSRGCTIQMRALRPRLRREVFVHDWSAPQLLTEALGAPSLECHPEGRRNAPTKSELPEHLESALDISAAFGRDLAERMDALDDEWVRSCMREVGGSERCANVARCRAAYAAIETHCLLAASCITLLVEEALIESAVGSETCVAHLNDRALCTEGSSSEGRKKIEEELLRQHRCAGGSEPDEQPEEPTMNPAPAPPPIEDPIPPPRGTR